MPKKNYFAQYKSPNIYIVPNDSICYTPSPKRPKQEIPIKDKSPQNTDISFLDDIDIDEIVKCLNDCDDIEENTMVYRTMDDGKDKDCIKSSLQTVDDSEINEGNVSEINEVLDGTQTNVDSICIQAEACSNVNDCNKNEQPNISVDENQSEVVSLPIVKESCENICIVTDTNTNINGHNEIEFNHTKQLTEKKEQSPGTNHVKSSNEDNTSKDKIEIETITIDREEDSKQNNLENCLSTNINRHPIKDSKQTTVSEHKTDDNNFNSQQCIRVINSQDINEVNNLMDNQITGKQDTVSNRPVFPNRDAKQEPHVITADLEKRLLQYFSKECHVISLIHSGKFSDVFKCTDTDGKHYAVKMKNKCSGFQHEMILNIIQTDIPRDNLMCIYMITGFSVKNKRCYLTDYYPKNLKELIEESVKNLHIDTIQTLAIQLVGALTTLRNKNIVHSDIKPSHILLDSTNTKLKVCGFDSAYFIDKAPIWPYLGSTCYRAPEIILGHSSGYSVDVWSTALVLHEMATGIQLFSGLIDDHVLYKQTCIFGNIPPQMLQRSIYRSKYNIGRCIQKDRCRVHKQKFGWRTKNILAKTIDGAYFKHWISGCNPTQIRNDRMKIRQFISLLEQMLVIDPGSRLPIEFVYFNPFCYEIFTC